MSARHLGLALALVACSASSAPPGGGGGSGGSPEGGAGGAAGAAGAGPGGSAGSGAGTAGAGAGGAGGTGGTLSPLDGGGSGGGAGACVGVSQQASSARVPADVIFALDTSASMRTEIDAVRVNLRDFSARIAVTDARIVVLAERYQVPPVGAPVGFCMDPPLGSGSCPDDSSPPDYLHVFQRIQSTDALYAFVVRFADYRSVLRADSMKVFVVVTDGDSAKPAAEFEEDVLALDPGLVKPGLWKLFGIYCFTRCPEASAVGSVYAELVQRTAGVAGDLCRQDFRPVFDALAAGVVASTSLDCGWDIPAPPGGAALDPGKVNVEFDPGTGALETIGKVPPGAGCTAAGGWYYDDPARPRRVLLCPTSCHRVKAAASGRIEIRFHCDTVMVPR